jgi:MarR family transcriptional regulator, lower aerobic nicotinate degradation pathway regulator
MSENSLPPALAGLPGFLIAKTHHLFHARADEVLGEGTLGIKHFGCLTVVAEEGPLSQQYLGARMRVDRTTMVSVVDDLEAAGFVNRKRNPEDRRAYALVATATGAAWLEEKRGALMEAHAELLAPLTAAERAHLVDYLQRLLVSQPAELVADPAVEVRTG